MSGSGNSWAICKSAPRTRQITMPAPHHSAVVKVDRRIRWHYTTTILRRRIGARLTRYRNCKFHADGISRYSVPPSAGPLLSLPLRILLKQETVSGSGNSWAICKSISHQITMPAPHHSVFYRPDALPAAQPTASKLWRLSHLNGSCHLSLECMFASITRTIIR